MESFIYNELNKVTREKDKSQIKHNGALTATLSFIINSANKNRKRDKLNGKTLLYRGIKLSPKDAQKYIPGTKIHLIGYTSTSKQFKVAHKFAFNDLNEYKVPVIYEIEFKGTSGLFELSSGYTAFEGEDEVLV